MSEAGYSTEAAGGDTDNSMLSDVPRSLYHRTIPIESPDLLGARKRNPNSPPGVGDETLNDLLASSEDESSASGSMSPTRFNSRPANLLDTTNSDSGGGNANNPSDDSMRADEMMLFC